jgi:hypothetical protein
MNVRIHVIPVVFEGRSALPAAVLNHLSDVFMGRSVAFTVDWEIHDAFAGAATLSEPSSRAEPTHTSE